MDDNASAGGDGTSWTSAHKYLQDALASAEYGDEIWVAEGTYKPDQGAGKTVGDRTASFNLVNGVGLYGGFLGREGKRDPLGDSNQTILSGEIDENSSLWSLHVVSGTGEDDANYTLDGFRITKGNANGKGSGYDDGGGIYAKSFSSISLKNCIFTNNSAGWAGGGIYARYFSYLSLINCVFRNNSADKGGGTYFETSINSRAFEGTESVMLTNCVFTNNSTRDRRGGAISYDLYRCKLLLTNCVFRNNSAELDGGAIEGDAYPSSTFNNCEFTNNSARNRGGAILKASFRTGGHKFTNCIFKSNSSSEGGGLYLSLSNESNSITNCIFTNNSARRKGGGIFIYQRELVYFSNFSNLTNCVLTNNSAEEEGGGIYAYNYYDSYPLPLSLRNCILWKNETNGVRGHWLSSKKPWHSQVLQTPVEAAYPGDPNAQEIVYQPNINILQGWVGDIRAFDADPLFVNIDNPIGPDGIWFTDDDGLRVLTGSPAINAGYNDALPPDTNDLDNDGDTTEHIPYDALGKTRHIGANVDIGAYEFGDGNSPSQKRFLLSLFATNGGLVDGAGYFEEGTVANFSATAYNGYIFSNWSGDATGSSNPFTISMDRDKSITANFSQDLSDTDEDGLSNYAELITHKTDPNSLDSDNDGLTDKQEIERGWNPNSSDKSVIDAVMEMKSMKAENVTPIVSGWYYVPNQGWLWTNKDVYPYTYSAEDKAWMYFQSGNANPKFYRYKTKTWLTME